MVQVSDHLGVAELQARWRESRDATLARHYQVIWLLAEGRSCAEVALLTGFVRRWVEELVARYNRFGPSSLGASHVTPLVRVTMASGGGATGRSRGS